MIFQTLDDKEQCVGVYVDGQLHFKEFEADLTHTWSYNKHLKGLDIEFANLYVMGKSLEEVCPDELRPAWKAINKKLEAFKNSFIESKIDLRQNCIYDLTPERFLKEYCELKNRISDHVFRTVDKPKEYEFFRRFGELVNDIRYRQLQLNRAWLTERLYDPQAKKLWEAVGPGGVGVSNTVKYNMFNSITGRLTIDQSSFPILTLSKKLREVIEPTNDWFVELDMNAAELRVAQALMNKTQIVGDFHEWCATNVFNGEVTRSVAKTVATQWLYNSQSQLARKYDKELSSFYNKQALLAMYWDGKKIHTPFGRSIECDEYHAISYLCQSTLIDLFHRQLIKVDDFLKEKKSFISLLIHDSVAIDLSNEDKNLLPQIVNILSDTKFGIFPVNVKIGPNYGDMKQIKIKV